MTITPTTIITQASYNTIQSAVANVLGVGSGDSGYGQSVASHQVVHEVINTTHIGNLVQDINTCLQYQNVAPMTTSVAPGNIITASLFQSLSDASTTIFNNRFNGHPMSLVETATTRTTPWGSGATPGIQLVNTFTFDSQDAARAFFNTSSVLRVKMTHPQGTTSQDYFWFSALKNIGIVSMGAHSTQKSGMLGIAKSVGYYELTTTDTKIFDGTNLNTPYTSYSGASYTGSGGYSGAYGSAMENINSVWVYARLGATPNIVIITAVLQDAYANASSDQVSAGTVASVGSLAAATPGVYVKAPTYTHGTWQNLDANNNVV